MSSCPSCGQPMPRQNAQQQEVNQIISNAAKGGIGNKLKSLRSTRVRPDAERKGGMTRGGRYTST